MAKAKYNSAVDEGALKRARIKALKGKLKETGLQKGLEMVGNKAIEQAGGATGGGFGANLIDSLGYGSYAPGGGVAANIAAAAPYAMMAAPLAFIGLAQMNRKRTAMAEEKKIDKLAKAGIDLPDSVGRFEQKFRSDLAPDFVGYAPDGKFVNNKFSRSRSEKDLVADDYLTRGALFEMFEGDQEAMKKLAAVAAEKGLGREAKGQIQTILTPELEANAEALGLKLRGERGDYRVALGDPSTNRVMGGLQEADRQSDRFKAGNPFSEVFKSQDTSANLGFGGQILISDALKKAGVDPKRARELTLSDKGGSAFTTEYEARRQAALKSLGISPTPTQNVDTSSQVPTFSKPLDLSSAMPTLGAIPASVKPTGQQISKERFAELFPDFAKKRDQSRGV